MERHRDGLTAAVIRNTSSVVVGRVASLALSIVPSVMLVRHLGAESLGQYASLYAFVALFAWLPTIGMDQTLVQRAAQDRDGAGRIIGTGILASIGLSLIAFVIVVSGSFVTQYAAGSRDLILLAAVEMLLLAPARLAGIAFPLEFRQGIGAAISIARQLMWAGSVAALVALDMGVGAFVVGRLVCTVAEVAMIYAAAARLVPMEFHWDWSEIRRTIRLSAPLGLGLIFVAIQQRVDQVFLHSWMGDVELGRYVAAVNITELFAILPAALMSTMLPVLSASVAEEDRFTRMASICFHYLTIGVFGICVVMTIGSGQILTLLYGAEFGTSAGVLSILVWSLVAIFLGSALSVMFIARGQQHLIAIGTLVAASLNVAMNVVLIPRYGAIGAAWATVVSYSIGNYGTFLLLGGTRSLASIGIRASFAPAAVALVTGLIGWFFMPPIVDLFVLPIFYLVGLRLLGVWGEREIRGIISALRFRAAPVANYDA